jgi:hypothetical protein
MKLGSNKRFTNSDVTVLPIVAHKQWDFNYNNFPTDQNYLTIYTGKNVVGTGSFSPYFDPISYGDYERLIYDSINSMFYQCFTTNLNTSSLASSLYYESASSYRPSSSYFIYDENPKLIKQFPTGANNIIRVISVNQSIYGNKIEPNTFTLSSSAYNISDDGYGNLWDNLPSSSVFVGNIFYSHGLGVITNISYSFMFPIPPNAQNAYLHFACTLANKRITSPAQGTAHVFIESGQINTGSIMYTSSGGIFPTYSVQTNPNLIYFPTQSDINEVTPGTYILDYNVASTLGVVSNTGQIILTLYSTPLSASVIGTSSLLVCKPSQSTNLNIGIDGGIPPYSYTLYSGSTFITSSHVFSWYQPTQSISLLTSSYFVKINDRGGNEVDLNFSIIPRIQFSTSIDYSNPCTASINVGSSPLSGSAPFTYSCVSGSVTSSLSGSSFPIPTVPYNSIYTVGCTDNNGCFNSYPVTVRGRTYISSGSFCEYNPYNITYDIIGGNGMAKVQVFVNNYLVTSSFATGSGNNTIGGNWIANIGDNITFTVIQSASNATQHSMFYNLDGGFIHYLSNTNNISSSSISLNVTDNSTHYLFVDWN